MFSKAIAKEWKYKWYGFWGAEAHHGEVVYRVDDYIDSTCPVYIRKMVVNYLRNSPAVANTLPKKQKCEVCDDMLNISTYHFDGTWLWPADLPHYVENHGFCVPNALVNHILSQDGAPSKRLSNVPFKLPWP